MPGFCIYAGELISQPTLANLLRDYEQIDPITIEDEPLDQLRKVAGFNIRPDGTIQFMYQWDEPLSYNHRGETKRVIRTFNLNVRIITWDRSLYFLVEKDAKSKQVLVELAKIIYNSTERILNASIASDLIKDIELRDAYKAENKWFRATSSLDKAVGLFGDLYVKNADGTHGQSEANRAFRNREQTASRFLSQSRTEVRVYVSAKKSSVTLKSKTETNVGLDDVEQYIRNFVLPGMVIESSV